MAALVETINGTFTESRSQGRPLRMSVFLKISCWCRSLFFIYPFQLSHKSIIRSRENNTFSPLFASLPTPSAGNTRVFQLPARTDALLFLPRVWKAAKTKRQWGGPRRQSEHLAGGVVPNLEESSVPFVTSRGVFPLQLFSLKKIWCSS